MSKGGGDSTQTSYQSSLPQYAKPYYTAMAEAAQREANRPYQPYRGQRLAGMDADTKTGLNMAESFARSGLGEMSNAVNQTNAANAAAMGYQNYDPAEITNSYNGATTGATQFGGQAISNFDAAARDQYMSPYMEAVVATSQRDAQQKALEEQAWLSGEAAQAGAFGGSRAAVRNQMALGDAQKRIADIGVQGRQAAFENAQSQFNADQARNLEALGMTEQARQFQEQAIQQGAEMGMTAQQLTEQFRQGGAELGLKGLQLAQNGAGQLAQMQQQMDDMRLQRIQSQLGVGQTREDYRQRSLDQAYDDFVNQRDAKRQQLTWLSSILSSTPMQPNQTQTTTTSGNQNPLAGAVGTFYGMQALQNLGRSS